MQNYLVKNKLRIRSTLSHYVSFTKIAGIRVLCMSLNLIKCSSHLKENKNGILFPYKVRVCPTCWLCYT